MRHVMISVLKLLLALLVVCSIALLLYEPQIEGRNAGAGFITIYFRDPFLTYVYISSIPYFVALYQAYLLLTALAAKPIRSARAAAALISIRDCALIVVACTLGAEGYFFLVQRGREDIAGGVIIGLAIIVISSVIAIVTTLFQGYLHPR